MVLQRVLSLLFKTFCALLILYGCAINPVTGKSQLMLLSEQGEMQLGVQTDQSVIEQYGLYKDSTLQSYVATVGTTMARISHRPGLVWQFKVMDSPVVNAFAAPGGYIYVTRGLLAALNNEAELAGVLGHEIGHVTARHSASQYSNMLLANVGLGVGKTLLGDYGSTLGPLMDAGTGLLFLKFSRDDERESDSLGVEYASRAGYNASLLANFFATLQRMKTLDQQSESGQLPEFLSTHPNPVNRQSNVDKMAGEWQNRLAGQSFRINRDQYLTRIDGLVYGEDPRKGFREEMRYYLPEAGVQFKIPDSWQFEREGAQAQILHPAERGIILFGMQDGNSLDQVVNRFVSSLKGKILQSQTSTVEGMPSNELLVLLEDGSKRALLLSRFFSKNGHIFMFHGLCAEADFTKLRTELSLPATSFGLIYDPQKLNPQPQRLFIKIVNRPISLQEALQDFNVEPKLWEKIAWLNAMRLTDKLAAGQKIKLIK